MEYAEAGFFAGIILYLTPWFPMAYRARATARFLIAIPLSQAIGRALGNALLSLNGVGHRSGWQWLFLLAPGIAVLYFLTDHPSDAQWLDVEERSNHWRIALRRTRTIDPVTVTTDRFAAACSALLFRQRLASLLKFFPIRCVLERLLVFRERLSVVALFHEHIAPGF